MPPPDPLAAHHRPTEALAAERNRFVAGLADEVIVAHAAPGGQLERLCGEVAASGKRLWTLADDSNKNLIEVGSRLLEVNVVTTCFSGRSLLPA